MALTKKYSKTAPLCTVSFAITGDQLALASQVSLLGDFNNWNAETHQLTKQKNGSFSISVELPTGNAYEFRYLIDNCIWINDDQGDTYTWSRVSADENFVVVLEAQKIADKTVSKVKVSAVSEAKAKIVAPKAEKKTGVKAAAPKATEKKVVVKTTAPKTENKSAKAAPIKAKVTGSKPIKTAAKPVVVKADDLTIIEGIGPVAAKALIAAGISTFDGLAKTKAADVKNILTAAKGKVGHLDPGTWAKQAKLAAAGKMDELETLKKQLFNGK